MVRFIKNYSLSLVLAGLFLLSWLFHGLTGWKAYLAEQKEHGAAAVFWGEDGDFWNEPLKTGSRSFCSYFAWWC
jgi:hypothetical protein